jgi:hypothetical protein
MTKRRFDVANYVTLVKIGNVAFNPDKITVVAFNGTNIHITFSEGVGLSLFGDEVAAFCNWMEVHANVYKAL